MTVGFADTDAPRNKVMDVIAFYQGIWARHQDCRSRRAQRTRRTKARWKCKARYGLPQILARISAEPHESRKPVQVEGAATH